LFGRPAILEVCYQIPAQRSERRTRPKTIPATSESKIEYARTRQSNLRSKRSGSQGWKLEEAKLPGMDRAEQSTTIATSPTPFDITPGR
jgi:hypothetical protein